MIRIASVCLTCVLALGCAGGDDSGDDHVFSSQQKVLDKARAVDKTIQDAAARQRQAIDEQDR